MKKSLFQFQFVVFVILLSLLGFVVMEYSSVEEVSTLSFSEVMSQAERGEVETIVFTGQHLDIVLKGGRLAQATGPVFHEGAVYSQLVEYGVKLNYSVKEDHGIALTIGFNLLLFLIVLGVFFWFSRSLQGGAGKVFQFGKSRAKLLGDDRSQVTFHDVAGVDEAKEELEEIVSFLREPQKYTKLGGRIPKGVLLMGPPGTGKTLLARAVAGEAGVPFFSISGSDFVEMFVGVGASRVRDLFEQATLQAPCIIFIDEIDAVGRQRGAGVGGGNDEREQTLNQLLVEMDGFDANDYVIVIAATNRPDVLDPALLRPGRFDRRVSVSNPDIRGRSAILSIHMRQLPVAADVDIRRLAQATPGFSGADLGNLCNEAALVAARNDKKQVEAIDFEFAREKLFMGPERRSVMMSDSEKRNTAYHEAGHAIVAHLLPDFDPVHKVTIVPRGRALGLTWTLPTEDRLSQTRLDLRRRIAMAMGGRAAEELALAMVTGGAANDLKQATQIARHMVCELGMSDGIGPVSLGSSSGSVFLGRSMGQAPVYSEQTAYAVDQEVRAVLDKAYAVAMHILSTNVHVLHRVAGALIDRESLDEREFSRLVDEAGPVPVSELEWIGA